MTDISTRYATLRDLPRIHRLIGELSAFHGDEAQVTLVQLQGIFFGKRQKGTAFVAINNNAIVGYAGVLETVAIHSAIPRFDIHHLYVVAENRSQGIGRLLIAAATAHATDQGAHGITIGTDPRNMSAQNAYRSMGLEEITDAGPRFRIPIDAKN